MSKDKSKAGGAAQAVALIGSNKYSAEIPLGEGRAILLSDLIEAAQKASGLAAEEWNALTEDVRDGHIEQALEAARGAAASGAQQAQNKPPKPPKKAAGLRITARRAGFRRAGHAWAITPTDVPASQFTKDQIAALRAEEMLTVEDIEIEG